MELYKGMSWVTAIIDYEPQTPGTPFSGLAGPQLRLQQDVRSVKSKQINQN